MNSAPSTGHARPDSIDRAAGLDAFMAAFDLRALRPQFLDGAEACRASVLEPRDDLGLSRPLRAALARRLALASSNPALVAEYPLPAEPALASLAKGEAPSDPYLAAIASHADMIASDPARSSAADLQRLLDAGLTVPQIVALSELLGFACCQIPLVHGLALLRGGG